MRDSGDKGKGKEYHAMGKEREKEKGGTRQESERMQLRVIGMRYMGRGQTWEKITEKRKTKRKMEGYRQE